MGFNTCANFAWFVDFLADRTGIHPHHFLFRGSTKIGFSISPNRKKKKTWQRLGPGSDLDLSIIDPHFYETLDEQVRRWDRIPQNRDQVYRYRTGAEFEQYQNRIYQKGRHDCYRFFDLPRGLECLTDLQKAFDDAPISECCVHNFIDLKAFIFRDRWAVHRRYHTDLDDLRQGLTTKENPLPKALAEAFEHRPP